jgi:heptosyltransferase-3
MSYPPRPTPFSRHAPRSIMVVCTRRIGDVLLVTPLIRSLKSRWPEAAIDAMVFAGTEGALAGNPDLRRVIAVPARQRLGQKIAGLRPFWRQYDLALAAQPSDRARLYAWATGRWRAGLLGAEAKDWAKRALLQRWVPFDDLNTHSVAMALSLAELVGAAPDATVVPPMPSPEARAALRTLLAPLDGAPYAVLHAFPKFRYKMWHADGWQAVAAALRARGLRVVLSGGPDADERAYVADLAARIPGALDLSGRLSVAQTAALLGGAQAYVGVDTLVTHLAAASGIPVVALFGPSNPVKWGPWPAGRRSVDSPWPVRGSGRVGNVFLLQGPGDCVPCRLEGCERHLDSHSDCLDQLPAADAVAALETLLAGPGDAQGELASPQRRFAIPLVAA